MTAGKHLVTIKGNKDGLIFILNDQCDFSDLLKELQFKLEQTHKTILTGPIVHVQVQLGHRQITEEAKQNLIQIIRKKGNLVVKSVESLAPEQPQENRFKVETGIIRSGQSLEFEGDILFVGDVHPGGTICSTGDIFIMGSLRGMAHAGSQGNDESVIATSHMQPTQLRISGVISRPPDEWGIGESFMEFAYLNEGKMEINKLSYLHQIRPVSIDFGRRL